MPRCVSVMPLEHFVADLNIFLKLLVLLPHEVIIFLHVNFVF